MPDIEQIARELIDEAKSKSLNATHIDQVKFQKGYVSGVRDLLHEIKKNGGK